MRSVMGFVPVPRQLKLILERLDLRSVNTNLMGHLTWPAASLQARLWERLARWAKNLCLRRIVDVAGAGIAFGLPPHTYAQITAEESRL